MSWAGRGPRIMVFDDVGPRAHPYLACFYGAMRAQGAEVVQGHFAGRWLLRHLRGVDVLHLHWPSFLYAAPTRRRTLYGAALLLFVLGLARVRRVAVVWTVHNLMPHEPSVVPRLDRRMRLAVVRAASCFLVHGPAVEAMAVRAFPGMAGRTVQFEFGNWIGLYPGETDRAGARAALGLGADARVVLFIGQIRPYKNVELLIRTVAALDPPATLVVAGSVGKGAALEAAIRAAATESPGEVVLHLGHVPDERMHLYLRASDVVAAPYQEALGSGTAVLAAAFGRPIVAPAMGFLLDAVPPSCGVLYAPGGLGPALERALATEWDEGVILAHAARSTWAESARAALAGMRRFCGGQ